MDGVLVVSEAVSWLKRKKRDGALLKLDFSKAYDSMRWSFLEHILFQAGFRRRMIGWIL